MSERVYVDVDLSPVLQTVRHATEILSSNLSVIDCKVDELAGEQQASKSRLEELYTEFLAFVAKDTKEKQLQLAATEIVRVRQELEKRFGNYDIVRRTAIGILQATNVAIIRQETMRTATEQLMLATPGYWLAPALIALTAWLHNDSALAERALREAIRRDDSRTSLFFTLVCRRADRMEASARWLSRYFEMQNPQSMQREVTVMLDALANGVFGGPALFECSHVFDCWLKELETQAGFVNEQRKRWANRLIGIQATIGDNEYRTLRSQSATGQALMQSLKSARRNRLLHNHFTALFTGEIVVPMRLEDSVDEILTSLVTNFDEEELLLRKEERLLQLIKDEAGDVDSAKRQLASEYEVFEETTSFAALLTNAAMSPELSGSTLAAQRYAVSRCRNWIIAAHQDLVGYDRSQVPSVVKLTCGSWIGESTDGRDEGELIHAVGEHYLSLLRQKREAIELGAGPYIAVIAGLIICFLLYDGWSDHISKTLFGLVFALAGIAFFFSRMGRLETERQQVTRENEREREQAVQILKACTAELADYRRELAREDGNAQAVTDLLGSLSSPQFVLQRPDQMRAVLT